MPGSLGWRYRVIHRIRKIGNGSKNAEEQEEKYRRGKDIHSYRVKVFYTTSIYVFFGEEPGLEEQVSERVKKTAIEMGDIIEEVCHHMPESLVRLYVLLSAILAIMSLYDRTAIQAILFFSLGNVRQCKKFS